MQRYYFDHNATTPLAAPVLDEMRTALAEVCGNASSIHYFGQAAKQRLETARRRVAALLGVAAKDAVKEIVFVSGGTLGNLAALTTARERWRRTRGRDRPIALASAPGAHSSIRLAAMVIDVDVQMNAPLAFRLSRWQDFNALYTRSA